MSAIKTTVVVLMALLFACKKPTENIKIVVDTDVIKHTAMINVTNAQSGNQLTTNATITITGEQADQIYDVSGKKEISLKQGRVTIGLHPNVEPTQANPITITVSISAPGYQTQSKNIVFTGVQKQQVINIQLAEVGNTQPPIVLPPLPFFDEVTLNFVGRCPNKPDIEVRPSVYVYFKKTGSTAPFQYLGFLDRGYLSTQLLAQNETYDFQIVFGTELYQVTQKIDQRSYQLNVDMPAACQI